MGDLIQIPTAELLKKFGSGGHKPGSGSASALMGLVSCKMIQTVIALTKDKEAYADGSAQLTIANSLVLKNHEPKLMELFQRDSDEFDRVIKARRARDLAKKGTVERKRLAEIAIEELRNSTETLLEIANISVELAKSGLQVFDLGFKAVRGDSAVAISSALGAASGAVSIIFLNLTSFKGSEWAKEMRIKAETLSYEIQKIQIELFTRMNNLRSEVMKNEGIEIVQSGIIGKDI